MLKRFARVFCLLCLSFVAAASRAGEGTPLLDQPRQHGPASAGERIDGVGETAWPETALMAVFGTGLSCVGLRLRKRKA